MSAPSSTSSSSKAIQQQIKTSSSSSSSTTTTTNPNHIPLAALDDFIQNAFTSCTRSGTSQSRQQTSIDPTKRPNLNITESFVRQLCLQAREVIMSQSPVLELAAPIKICGDFHGQFHDLLRMFEACGAPPTSNYLFLGDYVDRGRYGVETITLLLALKVRWPQNFFLLRGNHESSAINRMYGFYDECKRKFGGKITVWKTFGDVFNCLPVAAIVEDKIFCVHGGLSPEVMTPKDMNILRRIVRPAEIADSGSVCDLAWSDPEETLYGWSENESRGISYCFGPDVLQKFLDNNDFDLVCRGHQVCEEGYQFFGKRSLVTIFSAPNYCGEFDNSGAVMSIDADLMCSFTILKPTYRSGGGSAGSILKR